MSWQCKFLVPDRYFVFTVFYVFQDGKSFTQITKSTETFEGKQLILYNHQSMFVGTKHSREDMIELL